MVVSGKRAQIAQSIRSPWLYYFCDGEVNSVDESVVVVCRRCRSIFDV